MLQLLTFIDGEQRYLDLYGDENVLYNYSFAEVQDITRKNSNFTQSFKLPGSKNNNDIMNHFYDLNTTILTYDVRRTFDASMIFDGQEIISGYIRLNRVNIVNTEIFYDVTFYAEMGRLISNIGDKFMAQLNFSGLSHPYNEDIIVRSLYDPDFSGGTEPYENGNVYYLLANYGYEYNEDKSVNTLSTPIIDYRDGITAGYFDCLETPLRYYYLKPSIQIKWLYEQVFSEAGYKVKSDFFDTAYFKRFYLPLTFNKDSLYLNQAVKPDFSFNQATTFGDEVSGNTITWTDPLFSTGGTSLYRVTQLPEVSNNINAHQYSNETFVVRSDGFYKIRVCFQGYNSEREGESVPLPAGFQFKFNEITTGGHNGTSGNTLYNGTIVSMPAGGFFQRCYEFIVYMSVLYDYAVDCNVDISIGRTIITNCSFEILEGPRSVLGNVDYSQEFPTDEVKQIDFISTINKTFNLMVVEDKDAVDTLRVEPMIDYIGTGDVLDWTYKVDRDNSIAIEPVTNIFSGTLFMRNELDQDFGNNEFKKTSNKTFGTRQISLGQDFKNQEIIFDMITGNRLDYTLNNIAIPSVTLPIFFVTIEEDNEGEVQLFFNARKTLPNLQFRGINLPAKNVGQIVDASGTTYTNTFFLESNEIDMFPINNRFTTYPLGITNFTHAINFDKTDRFDPVEFNFTNGLDLYDIYYNDYVNDLISEENRLFSANIYLLPEEISALKGNEKILIDSNYFRINSITNYSLLEPGIAQVQLIKLTQDYEPHRKLCYKLTACDDPADIIYTNTDMNYTLFAYDGFRVKIGEICYTIELIDCNDSYTYQTLELPFQTNSFLPQIYTDCACSTLFSEIPVYNELSGATPSPTPYPTPTPSGPSYYYYIIEMCQEPAQQLVRSTTLYPLGTGVYYGGKCAYIYAYTSLVNTNDFSLVFSDCTDCINNQPTPTPTASVFPTPTPSSTGDYCDCREYLVENENPFYSYVDYIDCYGTPQRDPIAAYQTISICACFGSVTPGQSGVSVVEIGECILPTPTPTQTLTKTPTPTPTPTATIGLTPTPTPSCECKLWVIEECQGGTCSGGICSCESSAVVNVYTPCSVLDITAPGTALYDSCALVSPWTGDFVEGGVIYNSTGSDVVFVCNIGGPC